MKTLHFGGSFDPIHFGHLQSAQAVASVRGFDRVVLIPAAVSPHKLADSRPAPAKDRLAMCRLAILGLPDFAVDDRELRRPPPSYTIDTVRELKSEGQGEVFLLIGADQVTQLPTWHQAESLLTEATILVMGRPNFSVDFQKLPPAFRKLQANVVPVPLVNISGTDIRRRVREGRSIDGLTPPSVVRYILEHGLYLPDRAG